MDINLKSTKAEIATAAVEIIDDLKAHNTELQEKQQFIIIASLIITTLAVLS